MRTNPLNHKTGQKTLALAVFAVSIGLATGLDAQPVSKSLASGHDSTAPITVTSDQVDYDTNGKTGTFVGHVLVTQEDDKMRSDQVRVVAGADGKVDRMYATGNVVLNSLAGETATGDSGVYSVGPRIVEMTGNVVLLKGKDVIRGSHLTVSLDTGKAVLTNDARAPGPPGSRVQAVIMPDSNKH
jgi:lipopolysaccharide export system protein LptA